MTIDQSYHATVCVFVFGRKRCMPGPGKITEARCPPILRLGWLSEKRVRVGREARPVSRELRETSKQITGGTLVDTGLDRGLRDGGNHYVAHSQSKRAHAILRSVLGCSRKTKHYHPSPRIRAGAGPNIRSPKEDGSPNHPRTHPGRAGQRTK